MTKFRLKIKKIGEICDFELSWGKGKARSVQCSYPMELTYQYEEWKQAYLKYYQQLRGRLEKLEQVKIEKDWRAILVQAEARLLDSFHYWLLGAKLTPIRREIARETLAEDCLRVEVFLTCTPLELAKLPWETWEIGTDLGTPNKIRILRSPAGIACEPVVPLRRKPRILVISGDDTGLNFEVEKKAVQSLFNKGAVEFVGWQQGEEDKEELKRKVVRAIADKRGWDILFFFGHSNESNFLGGELSLAPRHSIFIREIEPALVQAKQHGLQFAFFNSCKGMDIADSLINLGFNQVAIMREPIHDRAARDFLIQFLRSLAAYKDVCTSMREACQFFNQQETRLTYPSTHLIPSLFCHPEAELFRLQQQSWKRWLPSPAEIVALSSIFILSVMYPLQDRLVDFRVMTQAIYRHVTLQINLQESPQVLLVHIDNTSQQKDARLKSMKEIDRTYLADLVDKLSEQKAKTIGIDYVLSSDAEQPLENSEIFSQAVERATKRGTWFVFGADEYREKKKEVSPHIANLNQSMQGDIYFFPGYVELLPQDGDCSETCPFAYLLAIAHQLSQEPSHSDLPRPQTQNSTSLRSAVFEYLQNAPELNEKTAFLRDLRLPIISRFALWLHPIVDFSVSPMYAYERISAYEVLEDDILPKIGERVVIIAPGGYEEAGLYEEGSDNFHVPLALKLVKKQFTGGEYHAYMLHHLLTQRLVVPIPTFWLVLVAAFLGKGIQLMLAGNPFRRRQWAIALGWASVAYVFVSFQLYISAAVLIPCVFPLIVFWNYVIRRKTNA